jgi:Zn-dependent protease with chaperone function
VDRTLLWTGFIAALLVGSFWGLHTYARWVERRPLETSEKVHRLRRMSAVALFFLPLAVILSTSVSGWIGPLVRTPLVLWGLYFSLFMVCAAILYLAVHPSYVRIRQLEITGQRGVRRALAWLALGLVPMAMWVGILTILPDDFAGNPFLRWGTFAVFVFALGAISPLLVTRIVGSSRASPEFRQRVLDLCRRQGVDVRDVRIIQGRSEKHANALFTGVLPGFRYVFLTDYLVEHMDGEELDAVLAHEIGHGKQHHILIKVGSAVVIFGVLVGGAALAGAGLGETVGLRIALLVALLVIMFGLPFIQGAVGIALEKRADDYAVRTAGLHPTVRALDKLAELNAARRRTGWFWNLLQQHPGIQQRIDRLRSRQGAAA